MDTEEILYVSVGVLSAAWLLLAVFTAILWGQHRSLRSLVVQMSSSSKFPVQKLKLKEDSNHAYQNPTIAPGEELSRRGYSMYNGETDLESNHSQASGPVFVGDALAKNTRQPPSTAPPFLLHAIETNKRKSLSNPVNIRAQANNTSRHSSNPNFIY